MDAGTSTSEWRVLTDPELVLARYLRHTSRYDVQRDIGSWAEVGKLIVGLRIETHKRLIAGAVGSSLLHLSKEECVATLDSVLASCGLQEKVLLWYERLLDWQKETRVRFEAIGDVGADVSPDVEQLDSSEASQLKSASSEPSAPDET